MANSTSRGSERAPVQRYFFEESNNLHNEVISLHNFVLPMSTAMWHFREVISKELRANPPPTADQLARKYNTAPKTRGSTGLIYPFNKISWDNQRQRIAESEIISRIKGAKKTPIKRPDSLRSLFHSFGIQGVVVTPDLESLFRSNAILS